MAVWSSVNFSALTEDHRIDAEHYQPECLAQAKLIATMPNAPLSSLADVSDGNHLSIAESFSETGIRYLRGQDLSDFFISEKSPVHIPESAYATLQRSHIHPGDVLLGIVATIGTVSFVTDSFGKLTANCKIAILRPREVEGEFLAAFFLSELGQREIHRWARGTVQTGVILPDLKKLPIPIVAKATRRKIAELVQAAYAKRQASATHYAEAEAILTTALGLDRIDLAPNLFYEDTFSHAVAVGRLDAEFFQPKYQRVLKALESTKPKRIAPLEEFLALLTNGHTPLHHDLSEGDVSFLTAEHVFDFRIDYDSKKRILRGHHDGELQGTRLRKGDCLITIKGRIGNAAIAEDFIGPVNINQDVALFRLKDSLPSYYLMAYLNSQVGKAFTLQYCTGQINPFLGLGNIRLLPIPVYDDSQMQQIARMTEETVIKARALRTESLRLLDEAKRTVETAILKGV